MKIRVLDSWSCPKDKQGGYEIVAGHESGLRTVLAGYQDMPVIVRDLNDEATIIMVDSNIQRRSPAIRKAKETSDEMSISHQESKEKYADLIGKGAKKQEEQCNVCA